MRNAQPTGPPKKEKGSLSDVNLETARQYDLYFGAGHYDRRYPRPNTAVLNAVLAHMPAGGSVLDYGCGSGRYLLPLAEFCGSVIGYDISDTALRGAQARLAMSGLAEKVVLTGPDPALLDAVIAVAGPVDVAACLFGVLSHIETAMARRDVLQRLSAMLHPDHGRIVVSVPNRRRRFRGEQRAQRRCEGGEIRYARSFGRDRVQLPYMLYDSASLARELEMAGLVVESIRAESVFSEKSITNNRWIGALDAVLRRTCPAKFGYGMIAVARPA
jgi:SAM-dependent methyltransferase